MILQRSVQQLRPAASGLSSFTYSSSSSSAPSVNSFLLLSVLQRQRTLQTSSSRSFTTSTPKDDTADAAADKQQPETNNSSSSSTQNPLYEGSEHNPSLGDWPHSAQVEKHVNSVFGGSQDGIMRPGFGRTGAEGPDETGRFRRPYYHDPLWWQKSQFQTEKVKNYQEEMKRKSHWGKLKWLLPVGLVLNYAFFSRTPRGSAFDPIPHRFSVGDFIANFSLIKIFAGTWLGQGLFWMMPLGQVTPHEIFWLEVERLKNNPEERAEILNEAFRMVIRQREINRLRREALGLEPGKYLARNFDIRHRRAMHEQFMFERELSPEERLQYLVVESRLARQRVDQRKEYIKAFQAAGYPGSKGLEAPASPIEAELRFGLPRTVL